MNKYEFAFILNAKIEDEARTEAVDKIKGYVERFGATITKEDVWGKKRLAYEIDKMTEGYYFIYKLDAPADAPAEIEKRVRIMEPVMRFMMIREEQ